MDRNGTWSLSPAYDVTYAYDPTKKWMKAHQMSINGKRDNINKQDLLALAKNMNIKRAKKIIDEVIGAVSKWELFATQAKIPANQIKAIARTLLMEV